MRNIKYIVIHCTAGPQNQSTENIKAYWKNSLGWKNVGYHILVNADGSYERLADDSVVTNGVANFNSNSIHISYKGGVDDKGKPKDTRTEAQKKTILTLVRHFRAKYPKAIIQGHKDFPKVTKACPSFDAKKEYKDI